MRSREGSRPSLRPDAVGQRCMFDNGLAGVLANGRRFPARRGFLLPFEVRRRFPEAATRDEASPDPRRALPEIRERPACCRRSALRQRVVCPAALVRPNQKSDRRIRSSAGSTDSGSRAEPAFRTCHEPGRRRGTPTATRSKRAHGLFMIFSADVNELTPRRRQRTYPASLRALQSNTMTVRPCGAFFCEA